MSQPSNVIDLAAARRRRDAVRRETEIAQAIVSPWLAGTAMFQAYLAALHRLQQAAASGLLPGGIDDIRF